MAEFKISFHEDSKFNLDHDNRKHSSPNINPEKTPENISYAGNISLQKFYEETFQKAYEEYIQKQIKGGHGNRVKNAPKTYYEQVVQKQAGIGQKGRGCGSGISFAEGDEAVGAELAQRT